MNTKTNRPKKPTRQMRNKRVFCGWIDPDQELPTKVSTLTHIIFGKSRWNPEDRKCKITVQWQ